MENWSKDYNKDLNLFFKDVPTPLAVKLIVSGRLSPLLIYTVGMKLVERFSDEQLKIIQEFMNPDYWFPKLSEDSCTTELCKSVFKEFGF